MESEHLFPRISEGRFCGQAVCGFGLVTAAARTSALIREFRPQCVTLAGIAGCYADRLPIGSAWWFHRICCYGIGCGTGASFRSAEQMGWRQWESEDPSAQIGEVLLAEVPGDPVAAPDLLSVTAASASDDDVQNRLSFSDGVAAEDMEAFAVGAACRLAGIPFRVVRGISNRAGDRRHENWKIREALNAVVSRLNESHSGPKTDSGEPDSSADGH